MKTLIIYNDCMSEIQYCIIDGDFTHMNGVTINSGFNSDLEYEAGLLLFDEVGNNNYPFDNDTKLVEDKNWDKIAVITFLP